MTLNSQLAERIRSARSNLTQRWVERIAARDYPRSATAGEAAPLPPDAIASMSLLIDGVAEFVARPPASITADQPLTRHALELADRRYAQGLDAGDLLAELGLLGTVLLELVGEAAPDASDGRAAAELIEFAELVFRAMSAVEQVTTSHYLRTVAERIGEREERLRRFSRLITHELKNRVGATLGAGQLLQEEWLGDAERRRFAGMVADNAQAIQKVLENMTALSRLDGERRRQRYVPLGDVVRDVFAQVRDLAHARDVDLRVAEDLPAIDVSASAVEMCLSTYLSNAIRYSDQNADMRWAHVSAAVEAQPGGDGQEIIVQVRDNGLGVPEDAREHLFERFFRAHTDTVNAAGTGLGLSLVQETVKSQGGRAWAEFGDEPGSVFAFALPARREGTPEPRGGEVSANDAETADDLPLPGPARATASD